MVLSREALESREKNSCAEVSTARAYARGFCVVFTPPVACKGVAVACKRCAFDLQEPIYRSPHFDVCDHEEDCHHADGCHPEEEDLRVC